MHHFTFDAAGKIVRYVVSQCTLAAFIVSMVFDGFRPRHALAQPEGGSVRALRPLDGAVRWALAQELGVEVGKAGVGSDRDLSG